MSDPQIHIYRMIVHKIDHKKYEEPQFSDIESPIPEDVCNFLIHHISSNRENKYTRNAKFIEPPEGEIVTKDICDKLLFDSDKFIDYSKVIANHLFQKMRRSKTISPGDLVLCEFDEGNLNSNVFSWDEIPGKENERLKEILIREFGLDWAKIAEIEKNNDGKTIKISAKKNFLLLTLNDKNEEVILKIDNKITNKFIAKKENDELNIYLNSRSLALLKLDPKDGFIGEREEINGQMRVVLRQVKDVLPSGDLQKCAFIIPFDKREHKGYDLKVLDQQAAKYGAQRLVASFFVNDFLQCKIGLNSADTTRIFVYGSLEWVDTREWPEESKCQFRARIREAVQCNIVDTTSIAQSIIPTPEEQDDYLDYLKEGKGIEDLTFEPDPVERKKLTRYAWFEGDQDLQIRINDDAIGPGKTLEYHLDEATNIWTIKITTTQWDEVIKRGR